MALSPRLEQTLKPVQQMILSPQMQQAIQILQMPIMELRLKISEEMALNPLLEESLEANESLDAAVSEVEQSDNGNGDDPEFDREFERLTALDDEWRHYFRQTGSVQKYTSQDEEKRRFMESSISVSETLHDHLLQQLHLLSLDALSAKIGEYIIGSIDSNGYLGVGCEQIASALHCPEETVEWILSKIQKFTPPGVGCRDLRECLFLQLNAMSEPAPPLVRELIEYHLEDLGKHRYPKIAKALKTSLKEVQDAAEFIAHFEPKPGRIFGQENVTYITPDIFIEEKNGDFEVILNDDRIPHLHISNLYRAIMNNRESPDETKNYIKNKVRAGMWLIKNIQQRQQTINNIMRKIVEIQKNFFREGVGHLVPMTMQEIASQLNIHESTVSRAISKKYVQTPQGLFPVKYFFSGEMRTLDGGTTSSRNIKQKIRQIVDQEDTKNPLSDQDIITLLKKDGIQLARRTVAKYRKELQIPSSNLRRTY